METSNSRDNIHFYKTAGKLLCIVATLIPCLIIVLRIVNLDLLNKVTKGVITQNPLSSVCLILLGISLWLVRNDHPSLLAKRISNGLAILVSITGLLKLIFRSDFQIDIILFHSQNFIKEAGYWNEMALNTALCHFLFGISIVLIDRSFLGKERPAQLLSVVIMLFALLSLYGYIYSLEFLFGLFSQVPMSFHTALCFFFLSIAILFLRAGKGLMADMVGENPVEAFMLRALVLILPLIVGWLRIKGEKMGLYSKEFGTAIFAIFTYIMAMVLLARKTNIQARLREERKKAEEAEKEYLRRLNLITDNNSTSIYVRDTEGKFLLVNKKFEKIFGVKREDVLKKHPKDIFELKLAGWFDQDHAIIQSGENKSSEGKIDTDKESHDLITLKFALSDSKGKIYAMCGVSNDVTQIRGYEQDLLENEELLLTIIDVIRESIYVVDSKGDFIIYNENAMNDVGTMMEKYSMETLKGIFKFYYPDEVTPYPLKELAVAKALRGQSTDDLEIFVKSPSFPDGKYFLATGRPLKKGGESVGLAVYKDITKRRKLQETLLQNKNRLKAILSTMGDAVIVCDTSGKFLLFNERAEEILGKGPEDISPSKWAEHYNVYYPDGTTPFPSEKLALYRALKGETIENLELLIKVAKDKEAKGKRVLATGRPIKDENGNITAAAVNFRDITEFKHIKDVLHELEEKHKKIVELSEKK